MFNTVAFFIPIFLNSLLVFVLYDYTFIDWFLFNRELYGSGGIIEAIASVKNSFGLLLIPFLYYYYFYAHKNLELNLALISSTFLFVISVKVGRFLFMAFPLVIPLALLGIEHFLRDRISDSRYRRQVFIVIISLIIIGNHIMFLDNYSILLDYVG
jgi:hypothetical protein